MKISAIVFLDYEYTDFAEYMHNLAEILQNIVENYEIIVIANGTGDFFRSHNKSFQNSNIKLRAFEFVKPVTQSVGLKAILKETKNDILLICGSYQQLTDESLVTCIKAMEDCVDIVSPWRRKRVDPSFNQFQSKVFNWITKRFVKTDLHDLSCTVRVCRRSVLEELDLYGNVFRFLPVLASAKGFKVKEVPVEHLQERGKTGFYSFSEYTNRFLDIFTTFFNTRFSRKPLRFFSFVGIGFIGVGVLLMAIVFFERFYLDIPVGNRPMFFGALMLMILGVLVSGAGLLGEIIAFTYGRHKKQYVIEKKI